MSDYYTLPEGGVFRPSLDMRQFEDVNRSRLWSDYRDQVVGCWAGYILDEKGRVFRVFRNIESDSLIDVYPPEVTGLTARDFRPCNIEIKRIDLDDWRPG